MNTGWALFAENNLNKPAHYDFQTGITYGSTEPSDHGLFYGVDEYVNDFVAEKLLGKYSPLQVADWLDDMARETAETLASAESAAKDKNGAEFLAMRVDLLMLCDFARYHAEKMRAATALALWRARKESGYLSDAASLLDSAIGYWEALAKKGHENYYHDLDFSFRWFNDQGAVPGGILPVSSWPTARRFPDCSRRTALKRKQLRALVIARRLCRLKVANCSHASPRRPARDRL